MNWKFIFSEDESFFMTKYDYKSDYDKQWFLLQKNNFTLIGNSINRYLHRIFELELIVDLQNEGSDIFYLNSVVAPAINEIYVKYKNENIDFKNFFFLVYLNKSLYKATIEDLIFMQAQVPIVIGPDIDIFHGYNSVARDDLPLSKVIESFVKSYEFTNNRNFIHGDLKTIKL